MSNKITTNGNKTNGNRSNGRGSNGSNGLNDTNSNSNVSKITFSKLGNYVGYLLLIVAFIFLSKYIYLLFNRFIFNFDKLGDDFDTSTLYNIHMTEDDFGLKLGDYIDFHFNIRTENGLSDCKIDGRKTREGIEYVDVKGLSNECQDLLY